MQMGWGWAGGSGAYEVVSECTFWARFSCFSALESGSVTEETRVK